MEITVTDAELELSILEKYVARHQAAQTANLPAADKCVRELDMREVLREITSEEGANLDYIAELWLDRLAQRLPGTSKGLLRRCSNSDLNSSAHKYHARAFKDRVNNAPVPAWDRIRELREKVSVQRPVAPTKELEQKFKISSANRRSRRISTPGVMRQETRGSRLAYCLSILTTLSSSMNGILKLLSTRRYYRKPRYSSSNW